MILYLYLFGKILITHYNMYFEKLKGRQCQPILQYSRPEPLAEICLNNWQSESNSSRESLFFLIQPKPISGGKDMTLTFRQVPHCRAADLPQYQEQVWSKELGQRVPKVRGGETLRLAFGRQHKSFIVKYDYLLPALITTKGRKSNQ